MDLNKVRKFDYQINLDIFDYDIMLLNQGLTASKFFYDSQAFLDIFPNFHDRIVNFHVGHLVEDDGRRFFQFSAKLSNGMLIQKSFWNFEILPIMTFNELNLWKTPRNIHLSLKIGLYEGDGSANEWQNILTKVEHFTPVCFEQTFHTSKMDEMLTSGRFANLTLRCLNDRELQVHKCILANASPYFRALFRDFFEPISNVIDVNFDYNVVKAVMSFIYSGRLDEAMVVNWPDLFVMARYYQLDVLAVHSELRMMVNMPKDMESIKKMIKFAIFHQAQDLKKYIIKMTRYIQETKECQIYWNDCVCPICLN